MKLVAIKAGFYDGARIRRGQSFNFDENREVLVKGKPVKVRPPKWALPPAEATEQIKADDAKEVAGDTKPKGAQKVSRARAEAGSGLV